MIRFWIILLTISFLTPGMAWATTSEITVKVNGVVLSSEIPPLIVAGRTMVPVRTISEAHGADVVWDQKTKTVILQKSGTTVRLQIGNRIARKSDARANAGASTGDETGVGALDAAVDLGVPPMLVEGSTLVPVRFISTAFNSTISWKDTEKTVEIGLSEKRDEKSPQEILVAASAVIDKLNSYRFTRVTRVTETVSDRFGSDQASQIMEDTGSVKKSQETYFRRVLVSSDKLFEETGQESEYYLNGTDLYQQIGKTGWEKLNDATSKPIPLLGDEVIQNPVKAYFEVKNSPIIASFGDDALVNGRSHYTIFIKMSPEGLKNYIHGIFTDKSSGFLDGGNAGEEALLNKVYDEFVKNLRFDLTYKVLVDKETMVADYFELRSKFKLWIKDQGLNTISSSSTFTIFDFDQPVEMPRLSSP